MEPQEGARPEEAHSDDFRMYEYKVKQCRKSRPHDWTLCPAAHNGEKAKRRDPRRFAYTGAACPDYRKNGTCRRGDACPFAHGVFESWLHPSRYRTQCCTDGLACRRRVCFFAHQDSELRKPEDDPALLAAQLQAESIASTDSYQQILAEAAIEAGEVPQGAGAQGSPQLNLALLQALLRSGGMERQQEAEDSQDRLRVLQLQALLATLQMRVSQAAPQRAPTPGDPLGHLDTRALGRLLAANQAHVQQQAEQDILHRNSLDAARRNSFSADVDAQRQDVQYSYAGGFPGGADYMAPGEQWSQEAANSSRRFSVDASGGSGLPLHMQGMDPRILAALSSQRHNAAQMAFAQAQSEEGLRRSVDMGSLAHNANMRHGANTASKQGAPQAGIPQPGPPPQQGALDMAALSNAFARSNLMEAQASGQLPPRQDPGGLHSKRASRDYSQMEPQASDLRRQYEALSSQASSQLQAQLSSQLGSLGQVQLGSLGQVSLGSLPLGSLGSILGQPASRMSSYGAQHSASQDSSSRRISFESLNQFSPGTHSVASSGSRNRGLTEQQAQLLRHLQAEEELERRAAEQPYALSGDSTPSHAPPTPGRTAQQYVMPGMASPRVPVNAESHLQGMPLQAAMGPTLKPSRSTPAIPEEGPAPSIADFPRSSLDAARMMPTLLEQLQMFEAQRRSPPPQEVHSSRLVKRNSSFESLSADLPRSISDLNLAEQASSSGMPQRQVRF